MDRSAPALAHLQAVLLRVEEQIALVDSLSPRNLAAESTRLATVFEGGHVDAPRFGDSPRRASVSFDELAATLTAAQLALADEAFQVVGDPVLRLIEGRVDELGLELKMVRARGTSSIAALTVERFPFTRTELADAELVADDWLSVQPEPSSDAPRRSLLAQLSEKLQQHEGPGRSIRLVEREIASRAAVGGDILYVGVGQKATFDEASRIWAHEVCGHLLPRLAARQAPPPFSLGTPGCCADEEGWALLQEQRAGLFSEARKREIALRFVIAHIWRESGQGAALERCLDLVREGHPAHLVAGTLCRVARGGGFCREVIYLPAYLRVSHALDEQPHLETYFKRGRVSVSALPTLAAAFSQG